MNIIARLLNLLPFGIIVTGLGAGKIVKGREFFTSLVSVLICLIAVYIFGETHEEHHTDTQVGILGAPILAASLITIFIGIISSFIYSLRKFFVAEEMVVGMIIGHLVMMALCVPVFYQLYLYIADFFLGLCTNFLQCYSWIDDTLSFIISISIPFVAYHYCNEMKLWPVSTLEKHFPVYLHLPFGGIATAFYVSMVFYVVLIFPLKIKIDYLIDYFVYTFWQSLYIFTGVVQETVNNI